MFVLQPACVHSSFPFSICRLGGMWTAMHGEQKEEYFARARQADAEHKKNILVSN
jgi:hypothetical protein